MILLSTRAGLVRSLTADDRHNVAIVVDQRNANVD